jgi:hypothetical protein
MDSLRPDDSFYRWFDAPLTENDIMEIEAFMNTLLRELLDDEPVVTTEELAKALPDKIQDYLDIAESVEKDANEAIGPELSEALRDLLKAVNAYYEDLS